MKHKTRGWSILYGVLLFGFTLYVLLDTFVIVRRYQAAASDTSADSPAASDTRQSVDAQTDAAASIPLETDSAYLYAPVLPAAEEAAGVVASSRSVVSTDTSYRDENIAVSLTEYRISDTTVYVADVQVRSSDYLKTAFADDTYGQNVTAKTSATAEAVDAILAVNGDYYGARRSGYVIRNGVLYRSTVNHGAEDLVIWRDGSFSIISEDEVSAETLLENGAKNVLSFGPALIENTEIAVSKDEEVGRAKASNPRTAIGIIENGHYVLIVSDGRTDESDGLSLYELATFMKTLGVTTGYNLDGGGSSSMVFMGKLINKPTTGGQKIKERSVSDIVYIGYGKDA